ncbi:protein tipE-like [Ctenocephalides felis]|uniref:protein tipE-like n=1 Tax=Ctenocephalides felis TaxID=7515 RepID=UPI000E6E245B|nr:protein tipE-like [Ctenocephalides felis]
MRSGSSELLLDRRPAETNQQQQQRLAQAPLLDDEDEARRRKLLLLAAAAAAPSKSKPQQRSCRERVWFYTTAALALISAGAGSSLLFLVPLYVDPAISTLMANFSSQAVTCQTSRREDLAGLNNCSWSSCREGCTSDMYRCTHIYVSYTVPPDEDNMTSTETYEDLMLNPINGTRVEDAQLFVNIKGCGYPPRIDCGNFTDYYGTEGVEFPCYYSKQNRTIVMTKYDRDEQVKVIVHFFAVPFVVTLVASVTLCVMHCDCRATVSASDRRRRPPRRQRIGNIR